MYNNLIKIPLEKSLAVANPQKRDPFIILDGGAIMLFEELEKVKEDDFSFERFCSYFADKYEVEQDVIRKDLDLVLNALQFQTKTDDDMTGHSDQLQADNTYQCVYKYFNDHHKIFKVFFELTYACNLKCKHCYLGDDVNSFKTKVTLDNAKQVLDQLKDAGVVEVTFTGGECTCHPNFYEIVEYACNKGFIVTILSNGTLMDTNLANKLVDLPISNVRISLYGLENYHDNFVGVKGAFQRSVDALIRLNQSREELGTAASVITNQNIDELKILNRNLKSMGIRHSMSPIIYPTVKGDLGPTQLRISKEEVKELILEGYIDIHSSICAAGISRLRISPNGVVTPCELFREFPFGNIFEESLSEILDSDKRKTWIHDIRHQIDTSDCLKCPKTAYCPKCIGVSYLENGDFSHQSTPGLCQLADAKLETLSLHSVGA